MSRSDRLIIEFFVVVVSLLDIHILIFRFAFFYKYKRTIILLRAISRIHAIRSQITVFITITIVITLTITITRS